MINFCRIVQPFKMRTELKYRRTFFRLEISNSFKPTRPVMDNMRKHVYLSIVPADQLSVHPNFICFFYRHIIFLVKVKVLQVALIKSVSLIFFSIHHLSTSVHHNIIFKHPACFAPVVSKLFCLPGSFEKQNACSAALLVLF
jgi:hypothetical protein